MRKASILLAILVFSLSAFGQNRYQTYSNARFGYSISYPSDLLVPQGESANADGQIFTGDGAEMRVFGSYSLLHETLRAEYDALLEEKGASITYKVFRNTFFVISGKENGRIFYQKTMNGKEGAFLTLMIEYDASKRRIYDAAVTKMVKSFN
jgi:hypothetical protein